MSEPLPLSVTVDLPEDVEAIIAEHEDDGGSVWTTIIHDALWEMRTRAMGREAAERELHEEIAEGLESLDRGEGVEIMPAWWAALERRCEENGRRIDEARAQGLLGNLLLPTKLYDFVTSQVAAGHFASPTELVSEAVRRCTWFWEDESDE